MYITEWHEVGTGIRELMQKRRGNYFGERRKKMTISKTRHKFMEKLMLQVKKPTNSSNCWGLNR